MPYLLTGARSLSLLRGSDPKDAERILLCCIDVVKGGLG